MATDEQRSIGEVLGLLADEFPDVTISKIRFLEAQGLLDPARTASGYRSFADADVERLRWILTQQRDHFLPLKVIKDRLDEGADGVLDGASPAPAEGVDDAPDDEDQRSPSSTAAARQRGRAAAGRRDPLDAGQTAITMTADELARASSLSARQLGDLARYGLITPRKVGGATSYDGESLVVATIAAAFLGHGVEARHLRMYKVAAEREAALFDQALLPLRRERAAGRAEAAAALSDLAALGEDLRAAMLREALRDQLD